MEEKNKRKGIIYLVIAIVTLLVLIAGATYAYFQAVTGNSAIANLNTTSGTTDSLTFSTTGDISLSADATNFGEGAKNIEGSSIAKATLIPNNTDNYAKGTYNVYLVIEENPFEYTLYKNGNENTKSYTNKEEKEKAISLGELDEYTPEPELLLTITRDKDSYMQVVTELTQYSLKAEDGTLDSYDITEAKGLITIAEDVPIEANEKEKIDEWGITITLNNLDSDQNLNTGKSVIGKIIIQKEDIATEVLDVCKTNDNLANCLIKLHDESEYGITKIVYHDEKEDYKGETNYELEAGDYSYRYSGSYEEVNNYICFGGECSNDPADEEKYSNLYRIIGVFPTEETKNLDEKTYQLKIIKADYATSKETGGSGIGAYNGTYGSVSTNYKGDKENYLPKIGAYYWNKNQNESGDDTNNWGTSNLQEKNLNGYYLSEYLGKKTESDKWLGMIEEDHNWITEGNIWNKIVPQNAKIAYTNEILHSNAGKDLEYGLSDVAPTVQANLGLIYVSDYKYGASKEYWTKVGYDSSSATNDYRVAINANWLYMGLTEWTITRRADVSNSAFYVHNSGTVGHDNVNDVSIAIRPCLYLNSNVKITLGSGKATDPYILSM